MPEYAGLKKDEKEKLRRAAKMLHNLTGESVDVESIPEEQPEEDLKAKQKRDEENLQREADITRRVEDARQMERQARINTDRGGVQDENPGPGQPAMVTEKAKSQGVTRKGEEPDIAKRGSAAGGSR